MHIDVRALEHAVAGDYDGGSVWSEAFVAAIRTVMFGSRHPLVSHITLRMIENQFWYFVLVVFWRDRDIQVCVRAGLASIPSGQDLKQAVALRKVRDLRRDRVP